MKDQKNTLIDKIDKTFLSFFGTGLSPKAPGTVGSLATVPMLYGIYQLHLAIWAHLLFALLIFITGCFVTEKYQNKHNLHDPGWIVIDEVVGMYLTWIVVPSDSIVNIAVIFILFRVFDILKPPPISYFDKKVQSGLGVMLDDVLAAIYSGLIYYFAAPHLT